jgi:2-polyprenyl-6-hydroxyphenyl methylase/3-demethylubiquinone-9 3-methyltransferase
MNQYYAQKLSAKRLELCYKLANQRIKQYLQSEINFTKSLLNPNDIILELGCGYGRIMAEIANQVDTVIGIDNSVDSLLYGQKYLGNFINCFLIATDASKQCFADNSFDAVLCLQNGLSAFHIDKKSLIKESLRVVKPGGILLFSSYSYKIWDARLEWFEEQSDAGLLGKIDYEKTKDGIIVCEDGFSATTIDESEFHNLMDGLNVNYKLVEFDESSLFCQVIKI